MGRLRQSPRVTGTVEHGSVTGRVGGRLRTGPWRGGEGVGLVAPVPGAWPPTVADIDRALHALVAHGYRTVVTPALSEREQQPFRSTGFTLHHRLHLLVHDLRDLPPADRRFEHRRARRRDRARVLEIDRAAFPEFWRLDACGLDEALDATPTHRFRVIDRPVAGYAIWGRAGDRGYLQRLAVDPTRGGHGLGGELVADGLRWMRRRVREVLVNTQEDNVRALALYERAGFVRREPGLAVLTVDLDTR